MHQNDPAPLILPLASYRVVVLVCTVIVLIVAVIVAVVITIIIVVIVLIVSAGFRFVYPPKLEV